MQNNSKLHILKILDFLIKQNLIVLNSEMVFNVVAETKKGVVKSINCSFSRTSLHGLTKPQDFVIRIDS